MTVYDTNDSLTEQQIMDQFQEAFNKFYISVKNQDGVIIVGSDGGIDTPTPISAGAIVGIVCVLLVLLLCLCTFAVHQRNKRIRAQILSRSKTNKIPE